MMSVMVYSRLGDLLRDRNLGVRDLQRQLATRFGMAVGVRTLDRLAQADRVRRPDLELAAAAAAVLGVGLSEIFAVETAADEAVEPDGDGPAGEEDDILDPEQSSRLQSLYERQLRRALTEAEWAELRELVAEWAHRVNERALRSIAAQRGQPIEQVRLDVVADFERALAWWAEVQANPARLEALVSEAQERRRARASG